MESSDEDKTNASGIFISLQLKEQGNMEKDLTVTDYFFVNVTTVVSKLLEL